MDKKRIYIQALSALVLNGKWSNFFNGTIYQGPLKNICVPALNCYSCPGALGSCPIGSFQGIIGSPVQSFSTYVVGLLLFYGILLGRWFCGFLCPFGFFQDLLASTNLQKIKLKRHQLWIKSKYLILIIFVIALPIITKLNFGIGTPVFCKYICPSGTLFAGVPLLAANSSLRQAVGGLFVWKLSVAIVIILFALKIPRFFCRYLCPLGAVFGLCNRHSLYSMSYDKSSCIQCGRCRSTCPMEVDPTLEANSPECIRCKKCVNICPTQCLKLGFIPEKNKSNVSAQ